MARKYLGTAPSDDSHLIARKFQGHRLLASQVSTVTTQGSTAEQTVVSYTIPANTLTAGCTFSVRGGGRVVHAANTTSASITYSLKLGSTTIANVIPSNAVSGSNRTFTYQGHGVVRSLGASGVATGAMTVFAGTTDGAAGTLPLIQSHWNPGTIDTTVSHVLKMTIQASHASNWYCEMYSTYLESFGYMED